jgi:uncharacterized membrane protein
MRRTPLSQLRPATIEIYYIILFACLLIILGNGKLILQRAGLMDASDLIGQQVSIKVIWGTNWLDTFRFTAGIINLIVWGATGLIIYSALQSIVKTLRMIAYERDFDSQQFVHPQSYTHQAYWRQVIADALLGFTLLAVLALGTIAYVFIAVPDSFVYIQRFILHPSLGTTIDPFIGIDIAIVSTGILYMLIKLVIRHHRTVAFNDSV